MVEQTDLEMVAELVCLTDYLLGKLKEFGMVELCVDMTDSSMDY